MSNYRKFGFGRIYVYRHVFANSADVGKLNICMTPSASDPVLGK